MQLKMIARSDHATNEENKTNSTSSSSTNTNSNLVDTTNINKQVKITSNQSNSNNSDNILANLNKKNLTNLVNNSNTSNQITSKNDSSSSSTTSSNNHNNNNDNYENTSESKIKIGDEFQADLSNYDPKKNTRSRDKIIEKETPVWKPSDKLDDKRLDDFLHEASSKHSYNIEQALAMLFWHKHNISKSLEDMNKYVPKPNEWTQEEKILFEQAYCFNGKNFNKIRQVLPDKSQASLVTYYYIWKKARLHTSQIENQQTNTKSESNTNGTSTNDVNENGNSNEDTEMNNASDDNDSVDDNFNNNVNKICCNCDLITNDLQSTPKGQLCNPCYTYWKDTSGLMRPDHLINKTFNHSHNHNYLQNSTFKTNRYLTISNTSGTNNNEINNINSNGNNLSREARNFHKSLRKPPKGIYLNYEELMDLVQIGSGKVFEELNKKIISLKKQCQSNKQEIDNMIKIIRIESEPLKSEINVLFEKRREDLKVSPYWNHKEIKQVLQGFNKFGDDFETISQIIETKSVDSIKAFYNYFRESLNLDKVINNNRELNKKAASILGDLKKLNRSDIPVYKTNTSQEPNNSDEIIII